MLSKFDGNIMYEIGYEYNIVDEVRLVNETYANWKRDTNCNGDRILAAIRPAPTEHTEGPKFNFMSQVLKHIN